MGHDARQPAEPMPSLRLPGLGFDTAKTGQANALNARLAQANPSIFWLQPDTVVVGNVRRTIGTPDHFWNTPVDPVSTDKANWASAYTYRLDVQGAGRPRETQLLEVDLRSSSAELVRSDAGTAVSGTLTGATAVMFLDDPYAVLASTSFVVPSSGTRVLMTGLAPGGFYSVATSGVAGGRRFTVNVGGSRQANHLGVLDLN